MRYLIIPVLIAASQMCAAAKLGLPDSVVPDSLGVNIHFTGKREEDVRKIAEVGFKFIRMDFHWQQTETARGQYDFKPYDELFSSLAKHGIRPLMILDYGNPLYDDGLAPHTDEGRVAFAGFAEAAAFRYRNKGIIWEIWNEPNHPRFWKPFPNAADYVKLAEVASKAIRKSDPKAVVVGPALSSWDFSYLESVFKLGLLNYLDAVSVHPYGSVIPEDAFRYYERVRSLVRKHAPKGKIVPVVCGEWGYASFQGMSRERQAQYVARSFLVNLMNRIPLSIWFNWRDHPHVLKDWENNCGIWDSAGAQKPAHGFLRTLAKELDGLTFAARIDAGSDDDYLALFAKEDKTVLAAWTTGADHKLRTPVDVETFRVTTSEGETTQVKAKDGRLELELTGSPIYITPIEPSRRWQVEAGWQITATTIRKDEGMKLSIESVIASEVPYYEFFMKRSRLSARRTKLEPDTTGGSTANYTAPYVSNGEPKNRIRVVAKILGLLEPLTRTVEFENSACPYIEVLPPTEDTLLIAVTQPDSGNSPAFSGRLHVSNYEGIRLESDSGPVKLKSGSDRQILRLKMTHRPAGMYSFSCRLADRADNDIATLQTKRYSLVETFSGGKPGDTVPGFTAIVGGDTKVAGEASLTYAESPKLGPSGICGKLDYRVDAGWKYAQVVPRSPLKIPERPRMVKIWVKGEGNDLPAGLRYTGSDNQFFQQSYGRLDTSDWRVLEGDISGAGIVYWGATADGIVRYPLSWDSLLLVDNETKQAASGTVYVGPAMICYD